METPDDAIRRRDVTGDCMSNSQVVSTVILGPRTAEPAERDMVEGSSDGLTVLQSNSSASDLYWQMVEATRQGISASEPIDRTAERLRKLHHGAALATHLAVGRIIIEELYGGDASAYGRRDAKIHSLRKLIARGDIGFLAPVLSRAVALYQLHQKHDLSRYPHLTAGRLREIVAAPETEHAKLLEATVPTRPALEEIPEEFEAEAEQSSKEEKAKNPLRNLRKRLNTELTRISKVGVSAAGSVEIERAVRLLDALREQLVGKR